MKKSQLFFCVGAFLTASSAAAGKLPGLGAPLKPEKPVLSSCENAIRASVDLTASYEDVPLSPRAKQLAAVAKNLIEINNRIRAGDRSYLPWLEKVWRGDLSIRMKLWGLSEPKKFAKLALDAMDLSSQYKTQISDYEKGLEIINRHPRTQLGLIELSELVANPLFAESNLAVWIGSFESSFRLLLLRFPEVRRKWGKRIDQRMLRDSGPNGQKVARDTLDMSGKMRVAQALIDQYEEMPLEVSASRYLNDHAFRHFARNLIGFSEPSLFQEFFVRDGPSSTVRGYLDTATVGNVALFAFAFGDIPLRMVSQTRDGRTRGDQYRAFEFDYTFLGYTESHRFRIVVCWNSNGCSDRFGQHFAHGEIVSLIPRCGPDVYLVPSHDVFESQRRQGLFDQGIPEGLIQRCKR